MDARRSLLFADNKERLQQLRLLDSHRYCRLFAYFLLIPSPTQPDVSLMLAFC